VISLALLQQLGPAAGVVLATILVKGSLILLLTGLAMKCLSRASAASRCAAGSLGLVALLVIPLYIVFFPSWQFGHHRLLGSGTGPVLEAGSATVPTPAVPGSEEPDRNLEPEPTASQSAWVTTGDILSLAFILIWMGGLAAMLWRLLRHALVAGRILRRSVAGGDPELTVLFDRLKTPIPSPGRVRLLISAETAIPFSCGILRPTIVLPDEARSWDRARKRSVLLHEYAHLVRHDHLCHRVIEIVRALYWPNPLVWFIARRQAVERERACDDFALRRGVRSATYAGHLLAIARSQLGLSVPVGSVTMAAGSGLGERIAGIMDSNVDRSPVRSGRLLPAANDSDPRLREMAVLALGEIEDPVVLDPPAGGLQARNLRPRREPSGDTGRESSARHPG